MEASGSSEKQGGSKATFTSLDKGSPVTFTVQYNPKEFRVEKSVTWSEAQTPGIDKNVIEYQKGAPMTASFDLIFDTTSESGVQNVQKVWVEPLMALTSAAVDVKDVKDAKDAKGGTLDKKRPRALYFQWGAFSMKCVVESVSVTYLMFASTGEAVRARCSVKLKEWVVIPFESKDIAVGKESVRYTLVGVKGGETTSQVAAANGSTAQAVAGANGFSDLMADLTGRTLIIPAKSAATAIEAAVRNAAKSAASSAVNAALRGDTSGAGKAAADSATRSVTGAASQAAKAALKKIF